MGKYEINIYNKGGKLIRKEEYSIWENMANQFYFYCYNRYYCKHTIEVTEYSNIMEKRDIIIKVKNIIK